jgi:glycosyltransferase involved in cell wall biosynthesis
MAEAMFLGKPVIATGYSGNMDFMDEQTALIVKYKLKPVRRDEYLFAENQQWAEPDLDQAAFYVLKLLDDPEFGRRLGEKASQRIRINFSYLAMGLKYHQRLEEIRKERAQSNCERCAGLYFLSHDGYPGLWTRSGSMGPAGQGRRIFRTC